MREEILRSYLERHCRGRQRAVPGAELARRLEISRSELQREVSKLRQRGVPVGSSRGGYFYAVTAWEVCSTARQLRRMAAGLEAAARGMEGHLDRMRDPGSADGRRA